MFEVLKNFHAEAVEICSTFLLMTKIYEVMSMHAHLYMWIIVVFQSVPRTVHDPSVGPPSYYDKQ